MPAKLPERDVVLIVDDVPDNLAVLSDALDEAGYMVIVATSGEGALERLRHIVPDVLLLDAMMPGLDGFETCRRIKAAPATRAVPVIFMTGLTDTEHVVQGFMAGGTDYVTKPIRPEEVLARIGAHIRNARLTRQAQAAIDALGFGAVVIDRSGSPNWMTRNAKVWLKNFGATGESRLPERLASWVAHQIKTRASSEPARVKPLVLTRSELRLSVHYLGGFGNDEQLLLLQTQHDTDVATSLQSSYNLTPREVEVLMWVAKGKTSKDIGDILGMSSRTVDKHLEHIYVKLGVETRAAAAALTISTQTGPRVSTD